MPRPLIPHKSGVHRAACFALFRALLRQKKNLSLREITAQGFDARIRQLFWRNAKLEGQSVTTEALQLGYRTLEVLQDVSKHGSFLDQLAQIPLISLKPHTKCAPPIVKEKSAFQTAAPLHKAPSGPLLERPHLNITGRRQVPILVNACRFPFLRIKKPQPPQLSRIISQSIKVRERRLARALVLRTEIQTAEGEDIWDRNLAKDLGINSGSNEPSWVAAPRGALNDVNEAQNKALARRIQMAEKMTDIVEKEASLAEEERWKRKDLKHKERKARRLTRQGRDPALAWKPPSGPKGPVLPRRS